MIATHTRPLNKFIVAYVVSIFQTLTKPEGSSSPSSHPTLHSIPKQISSVNKILTSYFVFLFT